VEYKFFELGKYIRSKGANLDLKNNLGFKPLEGVRAVNPLPMDFYNEEA